MLRCVSIPLFFLGYFAQAYGATHITEVGISLLYGDIAVGAREQDYQQTLQAVLSVDLSRVEQSRITDSVSSSTAVARGQLSEGSDPVNTVPSLLNQYWMEIAAGIGLLLVQLTLIFALAHALQERQKAEKERDREVAEREQQGRLFESVINGVTDAIVIVDSDQKIVATNEDGFNSTFGYLPGEMIGKPISQLVHPSKLGGEPESLVDQLSTTPAIRKFSQSEKASFPGEFVGSVIVDKEGMESGYFVIIRNITDRLKQEGWIRQAHKMEALGSLAGGIAHDFNNILTAIIGNTEIAKFNLKAWHNVTEGDVEGDPRDTKLDEVNNSLSNILEASGRATDLVRQISTFSRDSEEKEMSRISLMKLVEEAQILLSASMPSSIEIKTILGPDLRDINGNAKQVQQLIMNLCTNAQHAMNDKGTLSIVVENQMLRIAKHLHKYSVQPGDYIVLSVSDTGIGMTPELLEQTFDPLLTSKSREDRPGMGVALVYGIAESHGAYVDLTSAPGQGTVVSVYFKPLEDKSKKAVEEKSQLAPSGNKELVLLIDDEESIADINKQILIHLGYSVEAYTEPEQALRRFESSPELFDLVISDQTMPKMNGIELLKLIKTIRPDIPVILCTGYSDVFNKAKGVNEVDIFAVLPKPHTIGDVASLVSRALSHNSAESDQADSTL